MYDDYTNNYDDDHDTTNPMDFATTMYSDDDEAMPLRPSIRSDVFMTEVRSTIKFF